jgi:hypothetical protein
MERFSCRAFGHKPARRFLIRDPSTFAQLTVCKHCGVALERLAGEGWGLARPTGIPPYAARPSLPPVRPAIEEGQAIGIDRSASQESRAAYRRIARELYEASLAQDFAPDREVIAEWFERLDGSQRGDPPQPPEASQPRAPESSTAIRQSSDDSLRPKVLVDPVRLNDGGTADFVFHVRLEVPVDPRHVAVTVETQDASGEQIEQRIAPDHSPVAVDGPYLRLVTQAENDSARQMD